MKDVFFRFFANKDMLHMVLDFCRYAHAYIKSSDLRLAEQVENNLEKVLQIRN